MVVIPRWLDEVDMMNSQQNCVLSGADLWLRFQFTFNVVSSYIDFIFSQR